MKSFLGIWIGVMVIAAALAGGYYLLYERRGNNHRVPPKRIQPKGPSAMAKITLYFPDEQADYLVAESRRIPRKDKASDMAKAVLEALIAGPRGGLQPAIPHGTRIREVSFGEKGLCTVDLSEDFQKNHPGGTSGELMTVYSIVESLAASVPGVQSVQILVEGKPRETLAGHLYIGEPLKPDPRYIKDRGPRRDDRASALDHANTLHTFCPHLIAEG